MRFWLRKKNDFSFIYWIGIAAQTQRVDSQIDFSPLFAKSLTKDFEQVVRGLQIMLQKGMLIFKIEEFRKEI